MKVRSLVAVGVAGLVLAACGSTPVSPNTPLAASPTTVVSNIPKWYLNPPASDTQNIYVSGTGLSRDLSMSSQKALIDAQSRLADKVASDISVMTKDYKRDVGDESVQHTEVLAKKIAADVMLIGYVVQENIVLQEGGGFRTYVLLKMPQGNENRLLQQYLNRKSFKSSFDAANAELDQERAKRQ